MLEPHKKEIRRQAGNEKGNNAMARQGGLAPLFPTAKSLIRGHMAHERVSSASASVNVNVNVNVNENVNENVSVNVNEPCK